MALFHSVSKDYLPLYLNEFSFRNDNRDNADMSGLAWSRRHDAQARKKAT